MIYLKIDSEIGKITYIINDKAVLPQKLEGTNSCVTCRQPRNRLENWKPIRQSSLLLSTTYSLLYRSKRSLDDRVADLIEVSVIIIILCMYFVARPIFLHLNTFSIGTVCVNVRIQHRPHYGL